MKMVKVMRAVQQAAIALGGAIQTESNKMPSINHIGKRKPKPIPDIKPQSQRTYSSRADLCTMPCEFTGYFKKVGHIEIKTNWGFIGAPYTAEVFLYSFSNDIPAALLHMDLSDVESRFIWVMGGRYRLKNLQPFVEVKS